MTPIKVFVDSDVVIASLLSTSGAAHLLLKGKDKNLTFFLSNLSRKELTVVAKRLKIEKSKLNNLIKQSFKTVNLKESVKKIKVKFADYTTDPNDAHIVAGAAKAQAKFLLTYNLKDYRIDKIKQDFKFILLTPADFIQYLRSI